jgi:phosphohistidine phosphatase
MKRLFIVRHAKSSWDYQDIADFDRPLKHKGISDAHQMATRLIARKLQPDLIISSPANRALHTGIILGQALSFDLSKLQLQRGFYESMVDEVMSIITKTPESINNLMIVGHNPTWTNLANYLMDSYIDNIPTTGVVCLEIQSSGWASLAERKHHLEFFDYIKKETLPDAAKI